MESHYLIPTISIMITQGICIGKYYGYYQVEYFNNDGLLTSMSVNGSPVSYNYDDDDFITRSSYGPLIAIP